MDASEYTAQVPNVQFHMRGYMRICVAINPGLRLTKRTEEEEEERRRFMPEVKSIVSDKKPSRKPRISRRPLK